MTELLLRLFIKDRNNINDINVRGKYGTLSGIVGIICNLILCSFKITVGLIIGSISVMADGLNNLSDMGSSVVTMVGFKMAAKPADKDHPFGHGRIEYLSAFIVAMLILLVGFELIKSSAQSIFMGEAAPTYSYISYIVLILSIVIKLWLFLFNRKIGKKLSSDSLIATAQDSINDSIATFVIIVAALLSHFVPNSVNLDAIMGFLVGLFIMYSGIMTAKETVDKLLGQPPSRELIDAISETILSFSDFAGIHDLIIHNYGPGRCLASVHVEVSEKINVVHCHEQIDMCEKLVCEKLGVELTIHTDPIDTESNDVIELRQKLDTAVKSIHKDASIHDFRMTPKGEMRTNLIFDAVLPGDSSLSETQFKEKISFLAKEIDSTFVCVITVDRDYTGK